MCLFPARPPAAHNSRNSGLFLVPAGRPGRRAFFAAGTGYHRAITTSLHLAGASLTGLSFFRVAKLKS